MVRRLPVIVAMLLAAAAARARAEDAGGDEATAFLERWLAAQNGGDFAAYQQLYAARFEGVRRSGTRSVTLDRAGWLKERERMFRKPMTVVAEERKIDEEDGGYRLEFKQTWSSARYKDVGTKVLEIVRDDGQLRIAREEMLQSERDIGINGQALLVWTAGTPDVAREGLDGLLKVRLALGPTVAFGVGFPALLDAKNPRGASLPPGEAVVALGVCEAGEVRPMMELFALLGARVQVRPVNWPATGAATCPAFRRVEGKGGAGWKWDGRNASAAAGGASLTVIALHRSDFDTDAFGRAHEENRLIAVLKQGRAVKEAIGIRGGSDYAEAAALEVAGGEVVVRERYVDLPCNAIDKHPFARVARTFWFAAKDGTIASRAVEQKLPEVGECSQQGAQEFRRE